MSTQPPFDPSCQQVSPASSWSPGGGGSAAPSEYIPLDTPPFMAQPMPRPAYLYPLLYTPVLGNPPGTASTPDWPARGFALTGLLLGLVGLVLWLFPGLGDLVSLLGLTFSVLGWRRPTRRWMAILSCAFCAAAFALSISNSALGSYLLPH